MRRVRSQFLQSAVGRLGFAVRGRTVAGEAVRGGRAPRRSLAFGAAVVCALAASASPALATPGVLNWWGHDNAINPGPTGGFFGDLGAGVVAGLAVNDASGDVYAGDKVLRRVQHFTAAGAFVSAWGRGVVKPGGGGNVALNERQTVTIGGNPTGGTFTLRFGGTNAAASATGIPFNATPAELQAKLEGIAAIGAGSVSVTSANPGGGAVAGGPYTVEFVGGLADTDVAQMTSIATTLTPSGSVAVATTVVGAAAFEVCTVALDCQAGVNSPLGGGLNSPVGIAVDQADGHVYVIDGANRRVQEFTAAGGFVRAFGRDVVAAGGSGDSLAQPAKQSLTVDASAGQFKLAFQGQITGDLDFDAPAATIQAALQGLSSVGAGNATVTGGPGGTGGATPYTITFAGAMTNSSQPTIAASAGTVPLSGGAGASVAETQAGSTGFEICTVASECKAGTTASTAGAFSSFGEGTQGASESGLSVAPAGAPNAGNVLVTDPGNGRVQEFESNGAFVRAFGWAVAVAGPGDTGTAFEVCRAASFDVCGAGTTGSGVGQFGSATPNRVAEDATGNIYTVESRANFRVQRFALPGNAITPGGDLDPGELNGTSPSGSTADSVSDIAVAGDGSVFVIKEFQAGTGNPPVVVPAVDNQGSGVATHSPRILKVDPTANAGTGAIVDVMFANPGEFTPVFRGKTTGLAVTASGASIYAVGTIGRPNIFRLGDVPPTASTAPIASDVKAATATVSATVTPSSIPLDTSYHFEISRNGVTWDPVQEKDAVLGNGQGAGDPNGCPVGNPATCNVSVELSDLDLGIAYQVRVVTQTAYRGASFNSPVGLFTTEPSAPDALTQSASWSGGPDSNPTLSLRGRLNAEGAETTYRFEYVDQANFDESGYQDAATVPAADGAPGGHGVSTAGVEQIVAGLDPNKAYHYRLVATNDEGTTVGADRVVAPPNESDRFIELVSNGDGQGVGLSLDRLLISDDDERAVFYAQSFGDQGSSPGITNPFVAERTAGGWVSAPTGPGPDVDGGNFSNNDNISAALDRVLWNAPSRLQHSSGELQWEFSDLHGAVTPAGPFLTPLERTGSVDRYQFQGGSADLSEFVFGGPKVGTSANGITLLPGELLITTAGTMNSNLYEIVRADGGSPELRIVNRATDGSQIGGVCGARVGGVLGFLFGGDEATVTKRAVSEDGSVVYFSTRSGTPNTGTTCGGFTAPPVRLFKRVDGTTTVSVSESQCTRTASDPGGACSTLDGGDHYQGASADGSVVAFISPRQLVGSSVDQGDTDLTDDLYMYDASPPAGQPNLVQASAGEATAGHPTPGSGAGLLGVADVSADGSRVYFAATGQLTSEATPGANNLFVFERDDAHPSGRIAFVAKLSSGLSSTFDGTGDGDIWATTRQSAGKGVYALPYYDGLGPDRGPGDGRYLVFASQEPILAEDGDAQDDIYRYDDETGGVVCLSCVGDGDTRVWLWGQRAFDYTDPAYVQRHRIASEDGSSIVFATAEGLVAADTNATYDAYEWHDGELRLVSGATGDVGIVAGDIGVGGPAISPDGKSVFFQTRASLLPADTNNTGADWYVAREGGGFPLAATDRGRCDPAVGGCQGGGEAPLGSVRDTAAPSEGNAAPAVRKRLAIGALGVRARRKAARSGMLALRVRATRRGKVTVLVRGRVGGRVRRVGRASRLFSRSGVATVRVRLTHPARRRLAAGRPLALVVSARAEGARPKSVRVVLRRTGK